MSPNLEKFDFEYGNIPERHSRNREVVFTVSNSQSTKDKKVYTCDEALDISGNGRYGITLLLVLTTAIVGMGLDMFGVAVVVPGCTCEFNLDLTQTSIINSMPFIGPIVMSCVWGYISDTKGRRRSLVIAMTGSFIVSVLSSLSPNWIVLAVLKLISTSLCSCAQSSGITLLGECTVQRLRGPYILFTSSILLLVSGSYSIIGYFILEMEFSYDFGVLGTFTPWRLLVLVLAAPLGISAFGLMFLYESPKFLANVGREDEALEVLQNIWTINRGVIHDSDKYPVFKIESDNIQSPLKRDASLLTSLWEQTAPLFRPPLLGRTIHLLFLIGIIYSTQNSFLIWFPAIADAFFEGYLSGNTESGGFCSLMTKWHESNAALANMSTVDILIETPCSSKLQDLTIIVCTCTSVLFTVINLAVTVAAPSKKMTMITCLVLSSLSAFMAGLSPEPISAMTFFTVIMVAVIGASLLPAYFVDLYPTSYRGMAACLGVMVARASALGGISLVGGFLLTNCDTLLYSWSIFVLSGVIVALFLPTDEPTKKVEDIKS